MAPDQLRSVLTAVSGKWKIEILALLSARKHRFNQLLNKLPGVSKQTLTVQLHELMDHQLIERHVSPSTPLCVEYECTVRGRQLTVLLESAIQEWLDQQD